MKKINFTKMVAAGNDFVVIALLRYCVIGLKELSREICDRKFGVGADGLLVLEKSKIADIKMRIFNPDGSEAEMCGNGARCVAVYTKRYIPGAKPQIKIETKAGIINSEVNQEEAKIKLTDPKNLRLDIPIKISNRTLCVNFIDTGVPHVVIFVEGLDKMDVVNLGRRIRYHKKFAPRGANVDFVEVLNDDSLKIRTYERGVEDETLACGTGAVASALLYAIRYPLSANHKLNIHTRSKEILKVYFEEAEHKFKNIWLEGKARIVYEGVYYV
ncbi:MAG: diaminopimelate epimerase [Candidatus Omnitrophica bacterium]|nr:diaminopimelate epimerase [Candidatus Omnitrophota bacterium]